MTSRKSSPTGPGNSVANEPSTLFIARFPVLLADLTIVTAILPNLEERCCLDLYPALNVPASSTASRPGRLYCVQSSETLIEIATTALMLNRLAQA
jgi:hypothetical protein